MTSGTSPQRVCGLGFIWGKRVTGLPHAQALHHVLGRRGTAHFPPLPPDRPKAFITSHPDTHHHDKPPLFGNHACSGSLQCEIGNREINCGGKLCSQRLNPLPQQSEKRSPHRKGGGGGGERELRCRVPQPLGITHHEQDIRRARRMGGGEGNHIPFSGHFS